MLFYFSDVTRRQLVQREQMEDKNGALRDATFQLHPPERQRKEAKREEEN